VLPRGVLAPPTLLGATLGVQLSTLALGANGAAGEGLAAMEAGWATAQAPRGAATPAPPAPAHADKGARAAAASQPTRLATASSSTHARRSDGLEAVSAAGVAVASLPAHNSAGVGEYPLRSGLADAGLANAQGYYGGTGDAAP
jgi:hypothetical protein